MSDFHFPTFDEPNAESEVPPDININLVFIHGKEFYMNEAGELVEINPLEPNEIAPPLPGWDGMNPQDLPNEQGDESDS